MSKVIPFRKGGEQPPERIPAKIMVAIPSHENVPVRFAYDLAQMSAYTVAQMPANADYGISLLPGTYIHSARQDLLEAFMASEATHLLWVDSDMTFPRDALVRLMSHNQPAVGINYAQRHMPPDFVAFKKVGWGKDDVSERLVTDEDSTGLVEVEALGFGLFLLRRDALHGLPDLDDTPWFWFEWLEGRRQVGEDVWFCRLLRQSGVSIYVDQDLSRDCGHIGQFTFRPEHAMAVKAAAEEDTA